MTAMTYPTSRTSKIVCIHLTLATQHPTQSHRSEARGWKEAHDWWWMTLFLPAMVKMTDWSYLAQCIICVCCARVTPYTWTVMFKTAPKMLSQVYSTHRCYLGIMFPMVTTLLSTNVFALLPIDVQGGDEVWMTIHGLHRPWISTDCNCPRSLEQYSSEAVSAQYYNR